MALTSRATRTAGGAAGHWSGPSLTIGGKRGAPQAGLNGVFDPPPLPPPSPRASSYLISSILMVKFGGHLPTSPSF